MFQRIRSALLTDERGLTTVEYVIVLCLIAALSVGAWGQLGDKVKGYVETATTGIDTVVGPALGTPGAQSPSE